MNYKTNMIYNEKRQAPELGETHTEWSGFNLVR